MATDGTSKQSDLDLLEDLIALRHAGRLNRTEYDRLKNDVVKQKNAAEKVADIKRLADMLKANDINANDFQTLKGRVLSGSSG